MFSKLSAVLLIALALFSGQAFANSKWINGAGTSLTGQGVNTTTNFYYAVMGSASGANSENNVKNLVPTGGTLQNLHVVFSADPGGIVTDTMTIRKGSVATALTCAISNGSSSCNDTTHTVTIAANDLLTMEVHQVVGAGGPASVLVMFMIELVPTVATETILMGTPSSGIGTTGPLYIDIADDTTNSATIGFRQIVMPCAGTLKTLTTQIFTAPGGTATRTFTINQNASTTTLKTTYGSAVSGVLSDVTHTLTVAAGDLITLQSDVTGVPAGAGSGASNPGFSVVFVPNVTGDFVIPANSAANFATAANRFITTANSQITSATEANVPSIWWSDFKVTAAYAALSAAPGTSKSYAFKLRAAIADASTTFAITISGASTAGNATGSFTPGNGVIYDTQITPTGTPTAVSGMVSYLGHMGGSVCLRSLMGVGC